MERSRKEVYKLLVSLAAADDVVEIIEYYKEISPTLAERFRLSLKSAYNKLADNPQFYSYLSKRENIRDVVLESFPYVVIYEIIGNEVEVLAVMHTSRKGRKYK